MTWPASLVGRMTALVVVLGLLSLVLHLTLLASWMRPIGEDLVEHLTTRVRLERELLAASPREQRAALAQRLSSERHRVAAAGALPPLVEEPAPALPPGNILERVRERAGGEMRVVMPSAEGDVERRGVFLFEVTLDGERWRVEHAVQPPVFGPLGTGVGWLMLIATGVIASLVLGVRLVGRPLREIGAQIGAQHGVLVPLRAAPGTSTELRALIDSFNRLVEAVQRADATKQQMLAGVSHDLRTPLARLKLRIETQCDPLIAEELDADLQAIERIVSQFLAYVQGDSGAAGLGRRANLADVVARVVEPYVTAGQAVRAGPSDVVLQVPDLAVQRVLTNLIDNALSHGLPPVDVVLSRRIASRGEEVLLAVYDRGAGMTEADFVRAQQPFVRLAGASTELGHCGLGLAIVAQTAHQLGASLRAGREGQGRFGISLAWQAPMAP